jgi:hypothetical protein
VIHLFLDHEADPNFGSIHEGCFSVFKLVIRMLWQLDGVKALVKKFLDCGADPNAGPLGYTPLELAERTCPELAEFIRRCVFAFTPSED